MEVQEIIEVKLLEWKDAWSLFEKMATTETINSHKRIENSAKQIANELGGLPLAIIAVGKTMRTRRQHEEWEHALEQLTKARLNDVESQNIDNQLVFSKLKFSYDYLRDETLKDCFLHCSLWPEGFEIPKDELIELWMGSGLIDEPDFQTAYNIGVSYIGDLKAANLLEGGDDENFIKMHDVMRDMALWITRGKWIAQAGTNTSSVTINVSDGAEKLSAMSIGATKFSFSSQDSSTGPTLTTLLLNHNSRNPSITLPLELFSLLTILDLSHNNLGEFPVDICKLVHLEFLNLSHNGFNFGSLPEQLGDLTKLKYLLLRGLNCVFPEGVLVKLKALRVLDCSHSPFIYGNHNNEMLFSTLGEIQSLTFFQALGISLWDMQDIADFCQKVSVPVRWLDVCGHKASCLSFSTRFLGGSQFSNFLFSIDVKETEVEDVKFEFDQSTGQNKSSCQLTRLEYLHFRKMWRLKNVIWKNLNPKDVFPRLLVLEFEMCGMLSNISWVVNLPCIQELRVMRCNNLKQLICIDKQNTGGTNVSRYDVPLKKMHLGENYSLQSISDPMIITFGDLEILEVYDCDALKKLPFNTGDPPRKLKKMRVPEQWWNEVQMEDASHKSSLKPYIDPW
ncbi:Disease resistance protein RPS2 [Rhynchospora pubera]|uniref:Disease resistance protein RPS2 n=1 Tax=Rhynchospora pubera TaxID=906938 RepID=A0AAV8F7G8_9POAL|nr:Disease resistance protein RPS2 [Rhynchospora pubera]